MMNDDELDALLAGLAPPAGAAPRADAEALLARAALLAPPPVRPWNPMWGAALFAAGLLLGVGVDRLARGTPEPPVALAAQSLAQRLWAEPQRRAFAEAERVAEAELLAARAAAAAAEGGALAGAERVRLAEAEVGSLRARLRGAEARLTAGGAGAVAPAVLLASAEPSPLTCPTAEVTPTPSGDDWDLEEVLATANVLPGPNDLRLTPRERVERAPEEALRESEVAEVSPEAPRKLPLDLLVAATGGSSPEEVPAAESRGRVGAILGVSWRPESEGSLVPELFGGLGGGSGFAAEGADPFVLARIGAGVLIGKGFLHGAVDWSAALELDTGGDPATGESAARPAGFRTGPTVAAVFGREGGVRARLGFHADLHQRDEAEQRGVWMVDPGAALALEFPLGVAAPAMD